MTAWCEFYFEIPLSDCKRVVYLKRGATYYLKTVGIPVRSVKMIDFFMVYRII